MTKKLFALVLAGTLMVPHITPALGKDSTVGMRSVSGNASDQPIWDGLRLPSIPYIETMPWLIYGASGRGSKIDMLWSPKLNTLGPFLVQPEIPPAKFSSGPNPAS